ncbi:cytochrome c oxidase assembly protein [Terribacillus halophilus]|uniref:cytochrome c oxidase assembly protein n=1 Tax=Terribacillus halophilus TaxID=361279 RepID=UPI0009867FF5|nr:cytochrome c oxidase assembly protein [Terribacillus halophilus]
MYNDKLALIIAFLAILGYLLGMKFSARKFEAWPIHRLLLFGSGVVVGVQALAGPVAMHAHHSFVFHMIGHLLLGMLAPLLIALSRPITLLLRALPQKHGQTVSHLFRSMYARVLIHPVTAAVLNVGGLWVLYTTSLYEYMHQVNWVSFLVHVHVFAAGYLFTMAMLYTDPVPYRKSYFFRAFVFVGALAGHGILSKYLYANPPTGVEADAAKEGAVLMYYGGDLVDLILIVLLCGQWYRAAAPHHNLSAGKAAE